MKRRGFLTGLAAALAVVPVVASRPAEAVDVVEPVVMPIDLPPPRDLTPDEREAAEAHWRDVLLEHVKNDPIVQEILERRILERLHQQYPAYVRVQPTIVSGNATNVEALNWHPGQQYIYPDTPMEVITPHQPGDLFAFKPDGVYRIDG